MRGDRKLICAGCVGKCCCGQVVVTGGGEFVGAGDVVTVVVVADEIELGEGD